MGKAPTKPRSTRTRNRRATAKPRSTSTRKHHAPRKTKSTVAKLAGTVLAVAGTTGVMSGLAIPFDKPPIVCGGTERWPVKVTADSDAGQINLMPGPPMTVSQANAVLPEPYPVGGRMGAEKKVYTVRGYLSFFKHEGGKGDHDYHVVITDQPGQFEEDEEKAPNGHSMVVELPDVACFAGKKGAAGTSALGQAIVDARATFEHHASWPHDQRLTQPIPVSVTGVGFFDFDHGQTGRAKPHPGADGKNKVFELHPVTEIVFDNVADPD